MLLMMLALPLAAYGCPSVDGFVDFNCDKALKIAFTGDSIVYGVGDLENKGRGGYVRRLAKSYTPVDFENLGVRGITSDQLLRGFKLNLRKTPPGRNYSKSVKTDMIIIDVGRNDYWGKRPAAFTVRNIRRLATFLRTELAKYSNSAPLVVVNTLAPTTREYQKSFINAVNALLLKTPSLTIAARMDTINPDLISSDGLHPASQGYIAMTALLKEYLTSEGQAQCRSRRADNDHDDIFDIFEPRLYGTDPDIADTDGDGVKDGDELFVWGTNPLVPNAP